MNTAERFYGALRRIANEYMSPDEIREDCKNSGFSYEEYLEMAYENMQQEAQLAIRGIKEPK